MNYIYEYPGSTVLYILVIITTTLLSKIASKQKSKIISIFLLIVVVAIFTLVSGLRSSTVGTDTSNYIYHIRSWQSIGGYIRYPTEPGLSILSILTSYITKSSTLVLILVALIINGLIVFRLWSYRFFISFELSIMYYSLIYYIMTFSGIRQWLAISIVFWASKYVFERKYIKYILYIILASLFHNTAIFSIGIPLIVILFSNYKYHKKKLLISCLVIPLIIITSLFFIEIQFQLFSKYGNYTSNIIQQEGTGLTGWIRLIIAIVIYFGLVNQANLSKNDNTFFKKNYWVYFIGMLLIIPGYYIANINRLAFYYTIHEVVILGFLSKHGKDGYIKFASIMIFVFIVLMFIIQLMNSSFGIMPFIPYWNDTLMQ